MEGGYGTYTRDGARRRDFGCSRAILEIHTETRDMRTRSRQCVTIAISAIGRSRGANPRHVHARDQINAIVRRARRFATVVICDETNVY